MTNISTTDNPTLVGCEKVIRRSLLDAANALHTIRDKRLYLEGDFTSFDDYCRERLGFGRGRADQIIAAGNVIGELPTNVGSRIVNEGQVRALAGIAHDPEYVEQILDEIEADGAKITAASITAKIDDHRRQMAELTAGIDTKLIAIHAHCEELWAVALDAHKIGDTELWELAHEALANAGRLLEMVGEGDLDGFAALIEEVTG